MPNPHLTREASTNEQKGHVVLSFQRGHFRLQTPSAPLIGAHLKPLWSLFRSSRADGAPPPSQKPSHSSPPTPRNPSPQPGSSKNHTASKAPVVREITVGPGHRAHRAETSAGPPACTEGVFGLGYLVFGPLTALGSPHRGLRSTCCSARRESAGAGPVSTERAVDPW